MDDKTLVEREILRTIRKGKGSYGWYVIELTLSNRDVPRIPGVQKCLPDLEKRGLIRNITYLETQYWEITKDGRSFLEQLESESPL